MSRKIGILTFQNTNNYGAVLQTYALQRFMRTEMSGDADEIEVIDYFNDAVTRRETPESISSIRGVKQAIKFVLNKRAEVKKSDAVRRFCERYISYSKEEYYEAADPQFEDYAAIIAGSDQIWNLNLTGGDTKYMLDGYPGKGYSYAASIGREGIMTAESIGAIKRLRMVSVREIAAQKELQELGIQTELVCDPTLLIKKDEWYSLLPERQIQRRYILLYQMTSSEFLFKFAQKLAKEKNAILVNANPISMQIFKSRCIRDASPLEWLSLIRSAECVVTNSFHGLAFSINFKKEFYTEIRDNEAKNSSRISSLLDILGLTDRNINSGDFKGGFIDYDLIEPKLESYRRVSTDYIKRIIADYQHGG